MVTVNGTGLLVPPLSITVTLAGPSGALAAMWKVAAICVVLITVTSLTVMPGLLTARVASGAKNVPFANSETTEPGLPLGGLSPIDPDNMGGGQVTVNNNGLLAPALVVTVTW